MRPRRQSSATTNVIVATVFLTGAGKLNKARSYLSPKKEIWKKDGLD